MSLLEEGRVARTPSRRNQRGRTEGEQSNMENDRGIVKMRAKDIAAQIQSIEHFMFLFGTEGKYFLPPKSVITWAYVKQVLRVPLFKGRSTSNLISRIVKLYGEK